MDQPRRQAPKAADNNVEMCCFCALLLDFDTVDMLNKINKHVCCKAPSSSVLRMWDEARQPEQNPKFFFVRVVAAVSGGCVQASRRRAIEKSTHRRVKASTGGRCLSQRLSHQMKDCLRKQKLPNIGAPDLAANKKIIQQS